MMGAAGATAQTAVKATIPAADTVMLSDRVEGDYQVRRYLIRSMSDVDYSVLYRISVAKLNAALTMLANWGKYIPVKFTPNT